MHLPMLHEHTGIFSGENSDGTSEKYLIQEKHVSTPKNKIGARSLAIHCGGTQKGSKNHISKVIFHSCPCA